MFSSLHLCLILTFRLFGRVAQLALFRDQTQDSFHSHQVLLLLELSQVRGKLYALSQVDFVLISNDTRDDVLHIVPSACFRVLTHTPCILASESIFLGHPHRHPQA